jgi:hypothetical protein
MPDNEGRADMAQQWINEQGDPHDPEGSLSDVLTNLMHWADREGVRFDDRLYTARQDHEAEQEGES